MYQQHMFVVFFCVFFLWSNKKNINTLWLKNLMSTHNMFFFFVVVVVLLLLLLRNKKNINIFWLKEAPDNRVVYTK